MDKDIQKNKVLLLGKLFATLAHEIRNPLSVLKINLELLDIPKSGSEELEFRESISTSKEAVDRIETLVAQTMDFLRGGAEGKSRVDLKEVAENACKFLLYRANRDKIELIKEFEDNLPQIIANKNEILQIVINLVNNAMDAIPDGGYIKIKLFSTDSEVILEVEDNGIGIETDKQNKIFDEFFTTKTGGTGLGLSVCSEIAMKNNAELDFNSRYGKGTSFFVRFKNNGEI